MSLKSSHRITGRTGVRNARGSSSGSSQRTRTDGQGVGGGGCTDGSHTTGADRRGVMSFLVPGGSLGAVGDGAFAHDCGGWSVFVRTAGPCIGIWRPLGLACTPDVVPEATCLYHYLPYLVQNSGSFSRTPTFSKTSVPSTIYLPWLRPCARTTPTPSGMPTAAYASVHLH